MLKLLIISATISASLAQAQSPAPTPSPTTGLAPLFEKLERRGRHGRYWSAGIAGVGSIVSLGVSLASDDPNRALVYSTVAGALGIGALYSLLLPSDLERLSDQYLRLVERGASPEVILGWSQVTLGDLHDQLRKRRLIGGGVLLAVGAGMVTAYTLSDNIRANHKIFLYEGIILGSFGLAGLLFKPSLESEIQDALENPGLAPTSGWNWDLAPGPSGLRLSASKIF